MDRNNLSRIKFKKFLEINNISRVDARNVFDYNGKRYCFSILDRADTIRQFYNDCSGAFVSGCFIDKKHLDIMACTRKTPDGMSAYNAKIDYTKLKKSGLISP